MPRLKLSFIGTFEAQLDGEPIKEFESSKVRALLAYLVMEADRPHSRDHLAGMFWGESNDEAAAKNLRQALSNLRKAIRDDEAEHPLLIISPAAIQANPGPVLWLDTREFESLLSACESHPHRKLETCRVCARRMQAALSLYRGSFLQGFFLKESAAFQDWIIIRREYYHQKAIDALGVLVAYNRRRGEIKAAILHAQCLVALDPWREEAHITLMELLALDGQRSAALKQYATCRRVLMAELGVEPNADTVRLRESIRSGILPQVQERSAPGNLPVEVTSFVGRQSELAQISDHIQNPDKRLLTIVGPGGVGKTRLALQAARDERFAFADGVFWAQLENVPTADLLALAIADAVGFSFPSSGNDREQLFNYLRRREILLVLDNCEHLLDGADFVADLLRNAPNLAILATSRQPLQIQAEWLLELGGLSIEARDNKTPLQADLQPAPAPSDAVRLFEDRAQRVAPAFSLTPEDHQQIVRLCQILDGLPLGIELAAAWMRQLSPAQIAEWVSRDLDFLASGLRDAPERHRSLRVVFDQSWDMLTESERGSFASLSVFPSDFDRTAAQEICGAAGAMLNQLWQRSLVRQQASERFSLHPLLKQYAGEKLNAAQARELGKRFQAYHASIAVKLESQLQGADLKNALAHFSGELENLVEAWRLALAEMRLESLNTLLTPLFWYFEIKGGIYEGHFLFQKTAQFLEGRKKPTRAEANFARRLDARFAWLCFRRSEMEEAVARFQNLAEEGFESLEAHEQVFAMTRLASSIFEQGRKKEALKWLEAAFNICSKINTPWEEALTYNHYGSMLNMLGDMQRAEDVLRRSLQIADEHGYLWTSASALSNMAVVAYFREDYRAAIDMFLQSNEKALSYGDVHHSPSINHNNLADCYLQIGDLEKAREHLNQALYHFNECGNTVFLPYVYSTLAGINLQEGKLDDARNCLESGIQSALEHNMFSALNNLLADTARYYFLRGDERRSAAIAKYVLQSADTIKEGQDKAAKLEGELTEKFGASIWEQINAATVTRADILKLVKRINR
jgi:predicted ATPase